MADEKWDPLDQSRFFAMEKFEGEQFAITEPLLHQHLQSLIAAQGHPAGLFVGERLADVVAHLAPLHMLQDGEA